jgi:hypothetical protein
MKKYKPDLEWRVKVDHVRREAMQTIRDIRSGEVDAEQMDKLQNFLLFSLALMQMEGPKKWELAKLNAEIMSFSLGEPSSTN